jgi:hypothetical protein
VTDRLRSWQLSLLVISACVLAVFGVTYVYHRQSESPEWLFRRLPSAGAIVAGIDVKALRQAGVLDELAGGGLAQERDYLHFVDQTGFDYRTDLDYVALAWTKERRDILARGRFEWSLLTGFATSRAGRCTHLFCEIDGSVPGRKISFFPAASDVLAVSVGPQPGGAWVLIEEQEDGPRVPMRQDPIWLSMGPEWFEQNESYPAGLRSFFSALGGANRISVALAVSPAGVELKLDAECHSAEAASAIHQRLSEATALLRSMISRQGFSANPNDLSGVLASGKFDINGLTVHGRWPLTRAFLSGLLNGTV